MSLDHPDTVWSHYHLTEEEMLMHWLRIVLACGGARLELADQESWKVYRMFAGWSDWRVSE